MSYLYELEGIYAQLQTMELDDETFNDTLESIDFEEDLERNIEYFVKLWKNAVSDVERFKQAKQEGSPPRMRVKRVYGNARVYGNGITPAHAGKTLTVVIFSDTSQDHPRACG